VKVTEKEIFVPLRDFGDCEEMRDRDRDQFLSIWIKRDNELVEGSVAIVPASKGPILCWGLGKKKAASAKAVLRKGSGTITVNGKPIEDYFEKAPPRAMHLLWQLRERVYVSEALAQMEISIEVSGSNPSTIQQPKASAHALVCALTRYDPQLGELLKQDGFKCTK
jgi:small subunit ribosomal protein S9